MDIPSEGAESSTKRATNSYSTEEWKRKRGLITKLYFEDGKTLKDVRSILDREHDFRPT
jgi:Clr5 domain